MDALKNFNYSSSYQSNWVDVTEDFRVATEELKLGELVHDDLFGLYDAMAAIELMDPKMDAGMMCNKSKKVLPFEEMVENGLIKVDGFTAAELIGIIDDTFACLVTWLDGHSLAQTVFINLYLHSPNLIVDRSLKAFAVITLKLVEAINEFVNQASVYEEEDFQPKTYNFNLATNISVSKALTMIKVAEDELSKKLKSRQVDDEPELHLQALLVRLSFTRHFFIFLNSFKKQVSASGSQHNNNISSQPLDMKDFLASICQHLATCETLLKQWSLSTDLGVQPESHQESLTDQLENAEEHSDEQQNNNKSDYPTILGFEPLINQRLLPPSFPRYTKIKSRPETVDYLTSFLHRLKRLLTITDCLRLGEILRFLDDFSKMTPSCVVSRSMLQLFYLHPSTGLVFGEVPFAKAIKDSCRQFIRPPVLCVGEGGVGELPGVDAQTREIVEGFFNRCLIPFKNVVQTYGNNRARQREKIAIVLKDFGTIIEESVTLDRYLGTKLGHPFVFLQYWVFYHKLALMSQYLLSGFELELYSRHEYAYIFFELEKIWNNITVLLSQAEQISHQSESFTKNCTLNSSSKNSSSTGAKSNRKKAARSGKHGSKSQQTPENVHEREILYYKGISHLAGAYHHLCLAFSLDGKIHQPTQNLNTERIRYNHRFLPLAQFEGGLLSYERYAERYVDRLNAKNLEAEGKLGSVIGRLYYEATDQLLKARTHFEAINENTQGAGGGILMEEVQSCIKIAKTNTVVVNLLRSGHNTLAKPEFAFTESSHFPIIKFTKS